ncbi:MAG: hypothetical protein V1676_06265 [Candidatus Diapherotrites archaeon]
METGKREGREIKKGGEKEIKIVKRRAAVAGFFILFGIATIFFNPWGGIMDVFTFSFIFVGGFFLIDSAMRLMQCKKTGEVGFRIDERLEMNSLRASRKGFVVLVSFLSAMLVLSAFDVLWAIPFPAIVGPALALGVLVYFAAYVYYEKGGGAVP